MKNKYKSLMKSMGKLKKVKAIKKKAIKKKAIKKKSINKKLLAEGVYGNEAEFEICGGW